MTTGTPETYADDARRYLLRSRIALKLTLTLVGFVAVTTLAAGLNFERRLFAGLAASDEVRVNGIRKGSVAAMDLAGDHVVIKLALATDVQLTSTSRVAIIELAPALFSTTTA